MLHHRLEGEKHNAQPHTDVAEAVAGFRAGDGTHLVKDDRDDTHE